MLDIKNTTKGKLPSLPFADILNEVLGEKYELSLVFIGKKKSRSLNKEWRDKDKATNILSFPLSKTEGEIFINLATAREQSSKFDRGYTNFIAFLFIHGLHHLKGYKHGSTMEKKETIIRDKFNI